MELACNLDRIKKAKLTPSLYCYLVFLYSKQKYPWKIGEGQLKYLQDGGWLKIGPEGPVIRGLFKQKFKKYLTVFEVENWIEDWRNLFPPGVKSCDRPVKGSKSGCLKKMKIFMQANPDISKEQVMSATKAYVFEKSLKGFKFITCADYLIEKEGVSLLESLIEHDGYRGNLLDKLEGSGSDWHKEV